MGSKASTTCCLQSHWSPEQRTLVSLQALMAAGEAARATLALHVLLDEHKSDATTLLLLTKALLQTGSTVAVQDAVVMAR